MVIIPAVGRPEAGGWRDQNQPGLLRETFSQNETNKRTET
jgi:hypothetical protein